MKLAAAAALLPLVFLTQGPEKVIDVRANRPAGNTFEALWTVYKKADAKNDTEAAQSALREIRRLRIERNIHGLEVVALARVAQGEAALRENQNDKAEVAFRDAIALDPHLPDAYFALAQWDMKKGPLGIVPAVKDTLAGTTARLSTARGAHYLFALLVPVALLALFATTTVFALAMILRYASLLRHDLEEWLGPGRGALALGIATTLLLLPAITFQGYGWLPLWWLALLFIYMGLGERIATVAVLLLAVAVGPVAKTMDMRLVAQQNPLFWASLNAVEGGPDARAAAELEEASRLNSDDRDLAYLLGAEYKKAGRYEDAAALYRDILRTDATDVFALNNLANLEFAGGEFQAAIARYKQGVEAGPPARVAATFYYNLSLAHLQRFEYQPAQEARSQADRLASGLVKDYDSLWKYDKGDYAVVDLSLTADEVWSKFAGTPRGIVERNRAGRGPSGSAGVALGPALLTRFSVFPVIFVIVLFALRRWRGARMFTMRCVKCGTPFCKRCHLGAVTSGLCTQCHHLFIVRDGVSGPARNKKLLEVQKEDERRDRIFRILSLLSPGAGHLYAQKTLPGVLFVAAWSAILATALLAGRVLPVTEAPDTLGKPWGLGVAAVALLAIYVAANRSRPDFEIALPVRRSGTSGPARRRAAS